MQRKKRRVVNLVGFARRWDRGPRQPERAREKKAGKNHIERGVFANVETFSTMREEGPRHGPLVGRKRGRPRELSLINGSGMTRDVGVRGRCLELKHPAEQKGEWWKT